MQSRRVHLDVLEVSNPCTESWSRMPGDERSRFCGTCENDVYNLSAMTREQAEALLSRREGRLCVRFYRRADGTVVTADCTPQRFAAARRRARRALAFAGALVASTVGAVLGLGVTFDPEPFGERVRDWIDPEPIVMGGLPPVPDEVELEPMMGQAPMDLELPTIEE